jgi:putative ABC transport system substrate-binding protein
MNRREMQIAFALGAVATALGSLAQQPTKIRRVGWLSHSSQPGSQEFIDEVKRALLDLGYREGRDIVFDLRFSDGRLESLASLAAELVALRPDLIVTGATPGTRAAKQVTATVPLVMIAVSDPVGAGFVESLARPGGNITGVTNFGAEMATKPVELLHAVVPTATRIAVLMPNNPGALATLPAVREAARGLRMTLLPTTVSALVDIEDAFAAMPSQKAEALIVIADVVTMTNRTRIAELAAERRLPAIYQYLAQVEAGGLISYGPNPRNLHRIVASYIDKILKGAKPADLPVQQPTEFEMAINMRTAKALGITFPQEILLRADRVVE